MPKWKKEFFEDGRPGDIIIPVIGEAGTGKSSFINTLIGQQLSLVSDDLESGTPQIRQFIQDIPNEFSHLQGRRLILVDTPGFDIDITDEEVLTRISAWLAFSYSADMKIGGIIYLQDISQPRLRRSSRRDVEKFRSLCGTKDFSAIVFATTKWGDSPRSMSMIRERQLRETFWRDFIDAGASVCQFYDTTESAWQIVGKILRKMEDGWLDNRRGLYRGTIGPEMPYSLRRDRKSGIMKGFFARLFR